MASSSTSYANKNYNVFDIFLNHRGPDCKKPFATDLYNRLCKHGLRPFLDIEELREGDGLTCQIEGAIRTASVHIAIFSPRYAESEWCLNELLLMFDSRAPIIPVFYGVKPSDLRRSTGLYDQALQKLQKKETFDYHQHKKPRYESDTIRKWRQALSVAADISGFELEKYNGDEQQQQQQLVEKIVEEVLKRVPRKLHVSKYPIALEQKIEDFEREMCLQQQSEQTRVIGIVGLGGVGKTTLAKEIFNRRGSHFNRSCFLFDVRDKPLISLQSQLLKDLAQWNGQINSIDEGIEMLMRYLKASKAIIILDDVDDIKQMNALLSPAKDVLPSGSLILVNSRNMDVLIRWGIVESCIYKLTGLDPQQSKELFCSHAFDKSYPDVDFEEVVNLFLEACNGLPLSLTVLGVHLHGEKHLKYWHAEYRKISKALPTDIQSRLRISYDGLEEEEKHIFLDIACFFLHKDRKTAIRIWDGSGWEGELGFRNLQNRCLVEIGEENQIRMHDHLRDMGRDLAEKEPPGSWRRIWRPTDNLLYQHSPVRGVSVVPSDGPSDGPEWSPQHFKSLVELTWRVDEPPESLGGLTSLQTLDLSSCSQLQSLPESLGGLTSLQTLALSSCSKLQSLPESLGGLTSLKKLHLDGCSQLQSLPESLGRLTSLKKLHLDGCSQLQSLPESLGGLTSLETLSMICCSHLQSLPESLGKLTNLKTVHLDGCSQLQSLPKSLGGLANLQDVEIKDCNGLVEVGAFPASLRTLKLERCGALKKIGGFSGVSKLQMLNINGCIELEELPNIETLVSLQEVWAFNCVKLKNIQGLEHLTELQTLNIDGCVELEELPCIGTLVSLQRLAARKCCKLKSIEGLAQLTELQLLDVSECSELEHLEGLEQLASLDKLDASGCPKLQWDWGVVEELQQRLKEDFIV